MPRNGENGYINPAFNNGVCVSTMSTDKPNMITMSDDCNDNEQEKGDMNLSMMGENRFNSLPSNSINCISDEAAIVVVNACKSYKHGKKSRQIMHNLCMTVKKGTIYSLLGASGCG